MPPNEAEESKTPLPFLPIPHVLLRAVLRDLPPNVAALFLLVYQQTAGRHRTSATMSYADISGNLSSHKSPRTVSKTIRALTATGLFSYSAPYKNQTIQHTGTFTINANAINAFQNACSEIARCIENNKESIKEQENCEILPVQWKHPVPDSEPHEFDTEWLHEKTW